jgi:hypothetical protein
VSLFDRLYQGWQVLRDPAEDIARWRAFGREWAIYGRQEDSEACHEVADWLAAGFWRRMLRPIPQRLRVWQ